MHCCERGRVLAAAWNTFLVSHQDSVDALKRQCGLLQGEIDTVGWQSTVDGRVFHTSVPCVASSYCSPFAVSLFLWHVLSFQRKTFSPGQLNGRLAERRDYTRELEMLEFLKRENARFKSRESELIAKGLLTVKVSTRQAHTLAACNQVHPAPHAVKLPSLRDYSTVYRYIPVSPSFLMRSYTRYVSHTAREHTPPCSLIPSPPPARATAGAWVIRL